MNDPKRLRDGAYGDDLRLLVCAAQDDVLDDEAVARLHARLATAGVASSTTLAVSKASALRALGTKLVILVGVGAVAAFAIGHRQSRQAPTTTQHAVTAVAVAAPPPVTTVDPVALPETVAVTDLPKAPARAVPHVAKTEPLPPPPPAATTPREGLLLLQARRALPTDPTRALELVRQHAVEFPDSQLAPEREKIRREAAR